MLFVRKGFADASRQLLVAHTVISLLDVPKTLVFFRDQSLQEQLLYRSEPSTLSIGTRSTQNRCGVQKSQFILRSQPRLVGGGPMPRIVSD